MDKTEKALSLVAEERKRQFALYGDQSGRSYFEFLAILGEEYGELCEAVSETFMSGRHPERGGLESIVKEAVHVAAVAVQMIETLVQGGGDGKFSMVPMDLSGNGFLDCARNDRPGGGDAG